MAVFNDENGFYARDSQFPFIPGVTPPRIERYFMNPVRFIINYRVVPGFGILCGLLLAVILILMRLDEAKYATTSIILFGVIGLLCAAVLLTVPKTRSWEIAAEMKRYQLSPLPTPLEDPWVITDEDITLQFSMDGLKIDDKFYWYNHLSPKLATSNRFNRVWIALQFGSDPMHAVFVPLSPEAIAAVEQFSIPLQNKDAFDFLLNNKEKVFEEIYHTGSFYIPTSED